MTQGGQQCGLLLVLHVEIQSPEHHHDYYQDDQRVDGRVRVVGGAAAARPVCVSRVSGPQPFASSPCRGAPSMVWPTHGTAPQFVIPEALISKPTSPGTEPPRRAISTTESLQIDLSRFGPAMGECGRLRAPSSAAAVPHRARSASGCSTGRSRRHSSGRDKSRARPDRNIAARASGNNAPRAPSRSPPAGGSPAGSRSRASAGDVPLFGGLFCLLGRGDGSRHQQQARSKGDQSDSICGIEDLSPSGVTRELAAFFVVKLRRA